MLARNESTVSEHAVRLHWLPRQLTAEWPYGPFSVQRCHDADGRQDDYQTLAHLARALKGGGWSLAGCGSCRFFRFSGAAFQQSAGRRGYCSLIGFRKNLALVEIDHGCGEFESVAGWPDDLEHCDQQRRAGPDLREHHMRTAATGCLTGLIVGGALAGTRHAGGAPQVATSPLDGPTFPVPDATLDHSFPSVDWTRLKAVARALASTGHGNVPDLMVAIDTQMQESDVPLLDVRTSAARIEPSVEHTCDERPGRWIPSIVSAVPVGIYFWNNRQLASKTAQAVADHLGATALEASVAANLARLVSGGLTKRTAVQMQEFVSGDTGELKHETDATESMHALPITALACLRREPPWFDSALVAVDPDAPDADNVAMVVAALSGARNGLRVIPTAWSDWAEHVYACRNVAEILTPSR